MSSKLQQSFSALGGRILLIAFLVLSLAFVTVYFREGGEGPLHAAQNAVSGLAAPFNFVGGAVGAGTSAVAASIDNATASDSTLEGLRAQNKELREEIAKLEEYRQEAIRLEGLVGLKDSYLLDTVGARVTNRGTNSYEQIVSIDKGSDDGVIAGLPVMGPSGVIGQVVSATSNNSEIRLLGDPRSGIAVLIQSNRAEGIVKGSLEGLLYLEIDSDAEVQVGDVVVTSGLGGSYFRGLMVGMVVKVDENSGGTTRKIIVAPNESTRPLEEVLVVKKMDSEGDAAVNILAGPPQEESGETGSDGQIETQ